MESGRGGMGSRKHGKSGCRNGTGKSPKLRHHMKREAEKNERKAKKPLPFGSVAELMRQSP